MACYDNNCHIHYFEKDRSGWFPQKPYRRRLIYIMSK